MDYISRDYVLKCMEDSYKNAGISAEAASKVRKWLYKAPAANVREVKRGKWEEVEVSYIEDMYDKGNLPEAIVSMYCPICERYHNEVYWYGNPTENINFCPNCGADMREINDEKT